MEPMEQRGTREELAADLDDRAEGWYHLAKDNLSEASAKGAQAIREGAKEVQVGHTVYRVVGDVEHN